MLGPVPLWEGADCIEGRGPLARRSGLIPDLGKSRNEERAGRLVSCARQLLVVTLILASFAGGAFVNGPGLVWLKGLMGLEPRQVTNLGGDPSPDFDAEAPVVSVGPEPTSADPFERPEPADAFAKSEPPDQPSPASESLALAAPESPPKPDLASPFEQATPPPADPDSPSPPPLEPPAQPRAKPEPITLDPIRSGVPTRQMPPTSPAPSSDEEPGWGDAPGSAPAAAILPKTKTKTDTTRHDPQISGVSMPALPSPGSDASPKPASPAPRGPTSGVPQVQTQPASASPSSSPSTGASWNDLKQAMTTRGVTRYWVEGEPSGSVTFRCVVPLAGRGAISQQFEAQGEDVLSAAEAALKRIDLWKATEKR